MNRSDNVSIEGCESVKLWSKVR